MDRYCKINVGARRPEDVYADPQSLIVESNLTFPRTCVRQFPILTFAHTVTGRIYARFESGRLVWKDPTAVGAIEDPVTLTARHAVTPQLFERSTTRAAQSERHLDPSRFLTLGRRGEAMPGRA
jgi:hypothetical protein